MITLLLIYLLLISSTQNATASSGDNKQKINTQQKETIMTYRKYDSTKTRVIPVFDRISKTDKSWLRRLLKLPKHGSLSVNSTKGDDLTVENKYWGDKEKTIDPPVSLLNWLISNPPDSLSKLDHSVTNSTNWKRYHLWLKDPAVLDEAKHQLQLNHKVTAWYVLEGKTHPDVLIYTPSTIIVIEGKRTEVGPTKSTTWMSNRHQMLRHIDAAWEIRGNRKVFGFFIVEGESGGEIPIKWEKAARNTVSQATVNGSLPHRTIDERRDISNCFIGVTTWQAVCSEFKLDCNKVFKPDQPYT